MSVNTSIIRGAMIKETLASANFSQKTHKYVVPVTDSTAIFIGDYVTMTGAFDADGTPVVRQSNNSDVMVGVVVAFSDDPLSFIQYRQASTKRFVYVADDPSLLLEVQANGALTTSDAGKRANITVGAGDTTTGLSGMQLDVSTLSATTGQLKIISVSKQEDNVLGTNTKLICMIADHEFNFYPSGENLWDYNSATNTLSTKPANANVDIGGKLTVVGLIDPTGLVLDPQPTPPSTNDGTMYYDSVSANFKFRENGQWVTPASSADKETGVLDATAVVLSYNYLTRTYTISPTITSWTYFLSGVRYIQTAVITKTHLAITGVYFFYIDSNNVPQFSTTAPNLLTNVVLGTVTYNTASQLELGFDSHLLFGTYMDGASRLELYERLGAYKVSGCVLSSYTVAPAVPADAHNQIAVASGILAFEDYRDTSGAVGAAGPYVILSRTGVILYLWNDLQAVPFSNGITIQYNQYTGGIWQLTDVPNLGFVCYYLFKIKSSNALYMNLWVPSQEYHTTLAAAHDERAFDNDWSTFPMQMAPIARIIYYVDTTYVNTGKCRIAEEPQLFSEGFVQITEGIHGTEVSGVSTNYMGLVTCAGVTPVDTDFSTWETDSFGVAKGTGNRKFGVYKDATDVYYVEMTGI